jgi:hypothetical protein
MVSKKELIMPVPVCPKILKQIKILLVTGYFTALATKKNLL